MAMLLSLKLQLLHFPMICPNSFVRQVKPLVISLATPIVGKILVPNFFVQVPPQIIFSISKMSKGKTFPRIGIKRLSCCNP